MTTHEYDRAASAAELERFKTENLIDLAVAMGWTITEKGRTSAKVSKGTMKIAIFKGSSAWMWKIFTGEGPAGKAAGTVVDLALEASGGSMGKARQLLRSLTGTSAPTPGPNSPAPVSASTRQDSAFSGKTYLSPEDVLSGFKSGAKVWRVGDRLPPHMSERGVIEMPALFDGKFAVTQDRRRDARFLFISYDENWKPFYAGYEDRNLPREPGAKSYRRYASDARAGIWHVAGDEGAPVVILESPLDAISYDILRREAGREGGPQVSYIALRSGSEDIAVRSIITKINRGTRAVFIATHQDPAGMVYASKVMSGLIEAEKAGVIGPDVLVRYVPPIDIGDGYMHNDWNDVLMSYRARDSWSERKSSGGPSPRPELRPAPRRLALDPTAPCPA